MSPSHSWGTLTSRDNGATWTQTTIESGLTKAQWPTEPSAVYLGDGKILAIARTEQGSVLDAISIPDGLNRLRCDVDAHANKHRRCRCLHAEPDPRRQNRFAEQLLLSAWQGHPSASSRRSRPRVRQSAQLARFRGGRHGEPDHVRCGQRERHRDRRHTLRSLSTPARLLTRRSWYLCFRRRLLGINGSQVFSSNSRTATVSKHKSLSCAASEPGLPTSRR